MCTRHKSISFRKIEAAGEDGALMLRVANAVNDFRSVASLLTMTKELKDHADSDVREHGYDLMMFLLRIEMGFLSEAMLLLYHPHDPEPTLLQRTILPSGGANYECRPSLKRYLAHLSPEAYTALEELKEALPDGSKNADFERYVKKFRNRISFHYDIGHRPHNPREKPVTQLALQRLARARSSDHITFSKNPRLNRLSFADTVLYEAMSKEVWETSGIFGSPNFKHEIESIATWIFSLASAFTKLGTELCLHYFGEMTV